MIQMTSHIKPDGFIPVDEWDTPEHPIDPADRIYKHIKGEINLPICDAFNYNRVDHAQLDCFIVKSKRSHNSDETRDHICKYMNYFLKFYDTDKQLFYIIYNIKVAMDYNKNKYYTTGAFIEDLKVNIIYNRYIRNKIKRFVNDNYTMDISDKDSDTPNLQYRNHHIKILYEISMMMQIYIPLTSHYMYINGIVRNKATDLLLAIFDIINTSYIEERNVDIYSKLFETSLSVTNSSKNSDKILWDMNEIRGNNPTTRTKDSIYEIILQKMPKYTYTKNALSYNHSGFRCAIRYSVTDVPYEFTFYQMNSSNRDDEQDSEVDKYEASKNRRSQSLIMFDDVIANNAIAELEAFVVSISGVPISQDEIYFYNNALSTNGRSILNHIQKKLIVNSFSMYFEDPNVLENLSQLQYIKLIIIAKRMFRHTKMRIIPYIFSSVITKTATKKNMNKKEKMSFSNSESFVQLMNKYNNNEKVQNEIFELYASIITSSYMIIDYDPINHCPSPIHGQMIPVAEYAKDIGEELKNLLNSQI